MKKNMTAIELFLAKRDVTRVYRVCPRCGGEGTFLSGETCYYCQGSGEVD